MPELPDTAHEPEGSEAERLAAEFFHGDLEESARERLAERLEADPESARTFREAWRLEALLAAAHEDQVPAQVAGRIRAARRAKLPGAARTIRRTAWPWALGAAAACLLLAAALWLANAGGYRVLEGEVLANGKTTRMPLPGERLEVRGEAPARLQLADGSRVRLDPGSACTLHGARDEAREIVELERGCAGFEVVDGGGAFRVETAQGNVTVLGTRFEVALRAPQAHAVPEVDRMAPVLDVKVTEGRVRVEAVAHPAELSAGEARVFGDEARAAALQAFGEPLKGLQVAVSGKVLRGFDGDAVYLHIGAFERVLRKPRTPGAHKGLPKAAVRIETAALYAKLGPSERARVTALLKALREGDALTVAVAHREGRTFELLFAPVEPGDHSAGKCGCKK